MIRPPDSKLIDALSGCDPGVVELALALRRVVLEEAPEAFESIYKGYAVSIVFSSTPKPMKDGFCMVVAYRSHVNLGFHRGAVLPDPNKVLEGTGKAMRHIKIKGPQDIARPYLRRYIRAAMDRSPGDSS